MIVLDPGAITTVLREPREVQKEKQAEAEAANQARLAEQRGKNEGKKRMKVGAVCCLHKCCLCCVVCHVLCGFCGVLAAGTAPFRRVGNLAPGRGPGRGVAGGGDG